MPIYEYRCKSCGNISEYLLGVGDGEPIQCRTCGSMEMNKIMSAASVSVGSSKKMPGHTCCGREERCETPPCSSGGSCGRT